MVVPNTTFGSAHLSGADITFVEAPWPAIPGAALEPIVSGVTYLLNGPLSSLTYGDGFMLTASYDSSYRLTGLLDEDGVTTLRDVDMGYSTRDNLTSVTDQLDALRNEGFTYSARELLASASGPYDIGFTYDGVANRLTRSVDDGLTVETDTYSYPVDSNRLDEIDQNGAFTREFTYDAAGNVTLDARGTGNYSFTYNAANRMDSMALTGVTQAEYTYNAQGQQVIRHLTQTGEVIHSVHDLDGNRIAEYEYDSVSDTSTLIREYVWLQGMPIAVIESGTIHYIRTDHIGRPVFATDATGTKVWEATYLPFGGVHTSTGSTIDLRFPGQWFQSESALHQNWMRNYNPVTGRYFQPDPMGLIDGGSLYGYVGQNPTNYIDSMGLDRNNPRSGGKPNGGVGFYQGYGSFYRGLYRCYSYCFSKDTAAAAAAIAERVKYDEDYAACLAEVIVEFLKKYPGYTAGRQAGGQTVAIGSALGSPAKAGHGLVRRALGRLGMSIATGASYATLSGIGDFAKQIQDAKTGLAKSPAAMIIGPGYEDVDVSCECQAIFNEVEQDIRNEIGEEVLDRLQL